MLCAEAPLALPPVKATVSDSRMYMDVGAGWILPTVGVGYRHQLRSLGFDLSLKTLVGLAVRGNASLLHFPTPDLSSELYWGGGITAYSAWWYNPDPGAGYYRLPFGPGLVLGKSFQTKEGATRFIQGNADVMFYKNGRVFPLPIFTLTYGFCF